YVAGFIGETNLLSGEVAGVEDGWISVRAEGALLRGRATDPEWRPEAGASVRVSIRPEAMAISATGAGLLRGKIRERTYLGSLIQYAVDLPGGFSAQVSEMNPREIREAGEATVGLEFAEEDVVIMPK
ncbi:MAG: TOBE domain-containing protein, partial [Verrucomicrobiales bacterium]